MPSGRYATSLTLRQQYAKLAFRACPLGAKLTDSQVAEVRTLLALYASLAEEAGVDDALSACALETAGR